MASQHRKHRGLRTERVVSQYLTEWWPFATVGRGQGKDVYGVPFDLEIKARSSIDIKGTLRQIQSRTAKSGDLGFACFRLNGHGEDAREYVAMLRLEDLVQLLLKAGYKNMPVDPTDSDITKCQGCGAWMFEGMDCATCSLLNKEK